MPNKVFVVGVGMTKFEKPGRREGWDYPDMARESGTKALEDAGIDYSEVEQGFVGYCSGDSTSGNRALYELGMTGIPIVNVNNNCSTGSTALFLAAQAIRGGLADCAIALGFEKMQPGSLRRRRRRPRVTAGQARQGAGRDRRVRIPGGAVDVRRRRPRAHEEVRHHRRAFREDRLQEPQAFGEQPVRAVPGGVHPRRHPGRQDDLRPADQAAVLAHLRRFGRGDRGQRGRSSTSTGWPARPSRSSGRR